MGLDDRDYMRRPPTELNFAAPRPRREESGLGHRLFLSFLVLALLAGGGFLIYRDSVGRLNPWAAPATPASPGPASTADGGR